MANRIQLRRGTAAEWASKNPVLGDGEPGIERDTGKQKFGNGVSPWSALPYASQGPIGPAGVADDASVKTLITTPGTDTAEALNATILEQTAGKYAPLTEDVELDIWPAFNIDGSGPDSWNATSYVGFIAGIDAKLAGSATKETIGTASDGTTPVYAYTAGPASAPHVLINCGMHPGESGALFAGMRFFTEFATNDEPLMIALRNKVRITYIPELNPAMHQQETRLNVNGVDINRNFPWNWSYNTLPEKGAAALDQAETKIVKSVLDNKPIALLIDCHDAGTDSPEMAYSATSSSVHAQREIFAKAAAKWNATNPDAPVVSYFAGATDTNATLRNWGGKYLRWDKNRINAASVLFEGKSRIAGSTGDNLSRTGARWYASFIYRTILTWLEDGQTDAPLVNYTWWAFNDAFDATTRTTSITTPGGRLVDTTTYTPVRFSSSVSGANVNYVGFPIRHPGRYLIEWTANAELEATSPAARIDGRCGIKTMPTDGSDVTTLDSKSSGYLELKSAGDFGSFGGRFTVNFSTVPDDSLQLVQLFFRVSTAGEKVVLRDSASVTLTVTPIPNFDPSKMPVVPRPS